MAKCVARAQHVNGATAVDHLDASCAYDVYALEPWAIGVHDLRSGGVELDLDIAGDAEEISRVEAV